MSHTLESTKKILSKLVEFPVLSGDSNLEMIEYMTAVLQTHGITPELVYSQDKSRANLFATIGQKSGGGLMLSGHTDVVPVNGQNWSSDPFKLIEHEGKLYARGSADMKGFLACCLACVPVWLEQDPPFPIHLGFTYDEETGGYGANRLSKWLQQAQNKPACAIIGEPTRMNVIAGHKGGNEVTTTISGLEGHSSNPECGVSAIHYAVRMIAFILEKGEQLKENPPAGSIFNPPYSSFNIGTLNGGSSRNTIAGYCEFDWELRPVPGNDEDQIMAEIETYCQQVLVPEMRKTHPQANIETNIKASVPGLAVNSDSSAIKIIDQITGDSDYDVVAFGTDAGYFHNVGIDSVVFGPGSIEQAHKPDEFIELDQLQQCLDFLSKLHTVNL